MCRIFSYISSFFTEDYNFSNSLRNSHRDNISGMTTDTTDSPNNTIRHFEEDEVSDSYIYDSDSDGIPDAYDPDPYDDNW